MEQEYIILIARTCLFFSKCDNNYDEKERQFIQIYIEKFEKLTKVEDSTKDILNNIDNEELSIEGIIDETKNLVSQLSESEAKQTISDLEKVIEKVIEIDGVLAKEEVENFNAWKREFKAKYKLSLEKGKLRKFKYPFSGDWSVRSNKFIVSPGKGNGIIDVAISNPDNETISEMLDFKDDSGLIIVTVLVENSRTATLPPNQNPYMK